MRKVSILLSIYKPSEEYLVKQLKSLNEQDYPDLELLVWNDSPEVPVDEELFRRHITNFPVFFYEDGMNHGYCKAFEQLTRLCEGTYLTFCDQDDIWLPNKISGSVQALEEADALCVVCDRAVIDGQDRVVCPSVRHTSRWHNETWESCSDITVQNAFLCYGQGLCILARTDAAKMALPFCEKTGHDKWLLLCLSAKGKVAVFDSPVVRYRRHDTNVSGVLVGVNSKKEYYEKRVECSRAVVGEFVRRWPDDPHVSDMQKTLQAQMSRNIFRLYSVRKFIPDLYFYQIILSMCPGCLFQLGRKLLRN